MADMTHDTSQEDDIFPQDASGLPDARATSVVSLADGDVFPLSIGPVRKTIEGARLRMLAYNGSIPGPLLRVKQGTTVTVDVTNDAGLDQTVHWHGLRLDNRFDGVPFDTQQPIPTGGRYSCELRFPDPGLYWYHPHIREDYAQEMGLYGQIIVDPTNPDYWPPANRDIALTLDDLLLQDGQPPAFHRSGPTHTMMGRFGTILLVNGEQDPSFAVSRGEVVRLYLTNTANTRVFNLAITGATLKLIGGDSGRYEREELVDSILLSPSERAIVDVLFDQSATGVLEHRTPHDLSRLATFAVVDAAASPSFADTYRRLRTDPELEAERVALSAHRDRAPDKTLQFVGEMDMSGMDMSSSCFWRHGASRTGRRRFARDAPGGDRRRHRVGRHDAGNERDVEPVQHGVEDCRHRNRLGQPRNLLEAARRGAGQDPPGQLRRLRPPDAPPLPRPRGRPLPRARPRRRAGTQPGVEGHRLSPRRRSRPHPVSRHQPWPVDGSLPHCRAHRKRHDVQL